VDILSEEAMDYVINITVNNSDGTERQLDSSRCALPWTAGEVITRLLEKQKQASSFLITIVPTGRK
jgi:hypothetical protein